MATRTTLLVALVGGAIAASCSDGDSSDMTGEQGGSAGGTAGSAGTGGNAGRAGATAGGATTGGAATGSDAGAGAGTPSAGAAGEVQSGGASGAGSIQGGSPGQGGADDGVGGAVAGAGGAATGNDACGNQILDPGEGCDDGNDETGDGCSPACRRIVALSAGPSASHACVLLDDGSVKCWGRNDHGQLGLGDTENRGDEPDELGAALPPIDLGSGRTALSVATGSGHTCALIDDGSVKCWGNYGLLGLDVDVDDQGDEPNEMGDNLPAVDLGSGPSVRSVVIGSTHSCAILEDDSVKCWGSSSTGARGDGIGLGPDPLGDELLPVDLGTDRSAGMLVAGALHTCALLDDDSLKCWGEGSMGALGLGNNETRGDEPGEMGDELPVVELGAGLRATTLTAGNAHNCALLDDDSLKCWGHNLEGELGLGHQDDLGNQADEMGDELPVVELGTGRTVKAVSAGLNHSCAILDDDSIKCWGANGSGQLGLGNVDGRGDDPDEMGDELPISELGSGAVPVSLAAGWLRTCVLLSDATVRCWGGNVGGDLGLGDSEPRGDDPDEMGDELVPLPLP